MTRVEGRAPLQLVDASSDTAYRAVGGPTSQRHPRLLGMGQRHDLVLTAAPGAWPVVAAPPADGRSAELDVACSPTATCGPFLRRACRLARPTARRGWN